MRSEKERNWSERDEREEEGRGGGGYRGGVVL